MNLSCVVKGSLPQPTLTWSVSALSYKSAHTFWGTYAQPNNKQCNVAVVVMCAPESAVEMFYLNTIEQLFLFVK